MGEGVIADGMRIEWDVPITMDDGIVLRADIFRPVNDGKYPAILTYGAYGKGVAFQEGFKTAWDKMVADYPETTRGTTSKYQVFELVDPERWVPDGYVVIRVDARGCGRSPGYMDLKSFRETKDIYACIEWAAVQPWCTGKVGMNGISYYATNQWYVASMQPPHLAAICVWEGAGDYYRENTHHGGILCNFFVSMYPWAVHRIQHGTGDRSLKSPVTGKPAGGPETLSDDELVKNRLDVEKSLLSHPLNEPYYSDRSAQWDKINIPVLTAANWGGMGLHTRGNFEGYVRAASKQKWLEAHGDTHWSHFYTDYGVALQKRFLGHFLKGEDTGWGKQPPVQLQIRHVDRFVERHENEWPLKRTLWTKFYLDPAGQSLRASPPQAATSLTYNPMGDGLLFLTPPLESETEITGPVATKLFISSKSADADIFLVLRAFAPDGKEVTFQGSNDPHTPIGLGWLRASHRKLDPALSLPYRPYHTHDEKQPLTPGQPVELDVEIWPTCIVVPKGHRIGLSVRGQDYHYGGPPVVTAGSKFQQTGVGPFVHNNVKDRPPEIFGATVTLHFDAARQPYLLLPVIPKA
jgi:predicted acyl esterase